MLNNSIRAIIVYGSHRPGGSAHGPFADLPGEWLAGKIRVTPHKLPDDIGPGDTTEIPAWYLEFSDVGRYEVADPDQLAKSVLMYERWEALDKAVGPSYVRSSARWWPDGVETVPNGKMRVTNIYVPSKRFPYLSNQEKPPHPDKANDIAALWREVIDGKARYDPSEFIALIKDARPDDYPKLFGDLPNGQAFVDRLSDVFHDLALSPTSMLWDGKTDSGFFYGAPTTRTVDQDTDLLALAKAVIAAKAKLLPPADAAHLTQLDYRLGQKEEIADPYDSDAFEAEEYADDLIADAGHLGTRWYRCLREACYGIAGSYELGNYLTGALSQGDYDPEPAYAFWRAGGRYAFLGQTCVVWSVPLRETKYVPPALPPRPASTVPPVPPKPAKGWRRLFGRKG